MSLTNNDVKIVLGMAARNDKHHDIAAWFGENQARVAEALEGKFGHFDAAPAAELPPKGPPGIKGRFLYAFVEKAVSALKAGNSEEALKQLESGLERYNRHE